jgi:hypothetical protein
VKFLQIFDSDRYFPSVIVGTSMDRFPYIGKTLLIGLISAQILSTLQVYLSNLALYRTMSVIQDHGYLSVPNPNIIQSLPNLCPAFFGGGFFTFTTGAGISILSFVVVWIWDRIFGRHGFALFMILLAWVGCIGALNLKGFCLTTTLYFLVIPIVVSLPILKWMPRNSHQKDWFIQGLHLMPIFFLGLLWLLPIKGDFYLAVRDNLLLTNSLGIKINDLYYEYTLYPAEVIKSLDQKTIKMVTLEGVKNKPLSALLEQELLKHNYLKVKNTALVDLKVFEKNDILIFENCGRQFYETLADSRGVEVQKVLARLSVETDCMYFFRLFTSFSLVIGFPLVVYALLFSLIRFVGCFFLDLKIASITASILCFLIGLALLMPPHFSRGARVEGKDLAEAIESDRWQIRVAALKIVENNHMEIGNFASYRRLLSSPFVIERYRLVRALSVSRQDNTLKDLLYFMDDPNPTVRSMAFYALGQRGNTGVIHEIIKRIKTSDHWYSQLYAYHALMRLGWRQTASK